ncbi:hypothetical protein BJV78DRAFT_1361330 [Lactifluus subvellereus]|nr:hypothetical protein BJV78DRAFT_1361330 [Lactifluus subvellereus]
MRVKERRSGAKYERIRRRKKPEIGPAKASNAGKSQTQETANDLKRRANETLEAWDAQFKKARQKVAEKDEDIKRRAGETREDFRFRDQIGKAIRRR